MTRKPVHSELSDLAIDVIVMRDADAAWRRVQARFAALGIDTLRRFDAVEGVGLDAETLNVLLTPRASYELSVGRRYPYGWVHEGVPSLGAVGCYLSHLELWKRAAERSYPTLILEQDAEPVVSSGELTQAIAGVPADIDVAYLGHHAMFRPRFVEKLSRKPTAGFYPVQPMSDLFCTHAYLVTPEGAQKLAERALPINAQVDAYMRFLCTPQSGVQMICHRPVLIQQAKNDESSVQPDGTNRHFLLQGGEMAMRAAINGAKGILGLPWRILRRQLRSSMTKRLLREKGVAGYLFRHPAILRKLIRADMPSYDATAAGQAGSVESQTGRQPRKTIWTYWDQGIDKLPVFNRLCIATWAHHNPDWPIIVLDRSSLFNYLDPGDVPESWRSIDTAQSKSNLVRLALLSRYGGVWMDSSILLQQGLDDLVWDQIEQNSLELSGFSIRNFSRNNEDDVMETWFIACPAGSMLVRLWHETLNKVWKNRVLKTGILAEPLLQNVDRKNIGDPEYLNFHIAFQALIQKVPECREAYFNRSQVIPADDTAFRWHDRYGFSRLSALALLGSEYDAAHFNSTPLLKFTGWPAAEIYARLNAADLLDPGHTLGQLFRRNLPDQRVSEQ